MAREKAGYLQYLRLKGIRPGGCFCFGSEPERLYRVTKSGRLLNLADEPAELTENDFWERLDELCLVAEEKFGEARRRPPFCAGVHFAICTGPLEGDRALR